MAGINILKAILGAGGAALGSKGEVLGLISGIGRGTMQGLQMMRQREQEEAERQRQQRISDINLARFLLPNMPEKEAKTWLDTKTSIGDDDKNALMAIAGTNIPKEEEQPFEMTPALVENQIAQIAGDQTISKERKFNYIDSLIGQIPDISAANRKFIQGRARRVFDIPEPVKPAKPEKPDRTDDEILREQRQLIGYQISDIQDEIDALIKAQEDLDPDVQSEMIEKAAFKLDKLNKRKKYLVDKRMELAEPDAEPIYDLKKFLEMPEKIEQPPPKTKMPSVQKGKEMTEAKRVILRKKAYRYLKENADRKYWDRKLLTDKQIRANLDYVIAQGWVK